MQDKDPNQITENVISALIKDSWTRCTEEHGLEPDKPALVNVLTTREVNQHSSKLDALLYEAKPELGNLYLRLRDFDYLLTLTDNQGVTLAHMIPPNLEKIARERSFYNGSIWDEIQQGTNGVGTALASKQAISIVRNDHFSHDYRNLTCTASPILDSQRNVAAVLNVTTPRYSNHQEQAITLQIIKQAAKRIENMWFLNKFNHYKVLQVSHANNFADIANGELIALDEDHRFIASTLPKSTTEDFSKPGKDFFQNALGIGHEEALQTISGSNPLYAAHSGKFGQFGVYMQQRNTSLEQKQYLMPASSDRFPIKQEDKSSSSIAEYAKPEFTGQDPQLLRSMKVARKALNANLPILLKGAMGTGKSAVAKTIHQGSIYAETPFTPIHCAAIPENLFESALLGYNTQSIETQVIETKDTKEFKNPHQTNKRGTVYLDEIGDLPISLQMRLMRVLTEKQVFPVGATRPVNFDVNLISSTSEDLLQLVADGKFREDLYYTIAIAPFEIPSLAQRSDKKQLIRATFAQLCDESDGTYELSEATETLLSAHDWKGNLRELINVLKYAIILDSDGLITPEDLPETLHFSNSKNTIDSSEDFAVEEVEILRQTLQRSNGNVSDCAKKMGISRSTLYRKMKKLGLH